MPDAVIEISGLRKSYFRLHRPRRVALDGLDLVVPQGGVHGFLGPNGSGKTTTIRVLLGLCRPDSGRIRIMGADVPRSLPAVISELGALVETPRFHPESSGRFNLGLLARAGDLPPTRVEEVLELVGLRDRAGDAFAGYSLGMKQRLGIAAALLRRPRLVILDEPGNGLDPEGLRDVRDLIRQLGSQGHTTVLLSSHLLPEVQSVCDRVSVLARGRCVASGTVAELLAAPGDADLQVRADRHDAARAVLEDAGWQVSAMTGSGEPPSWRVHAVADRAAVTSTLAERRIYVTELIPLQRDLESAYLELTATHTQAHTEAPIEASGGARAEAEGQPR